MDTLAEVIATTASSDIFFAVIYNVNLYPICGSSIFCQHLCTYLVISNNAFRLRKFFQFFPDLDQQAYLWILNAISHVSADTECLNILIAKFKAPSDEYLRQFEEYIEKLKPK